MSKGSLPEKQSALLPLRQEVIIHIENWLAGRLYDYLYMPAVHVNTLMSLSSLLRHEVLSQQGGYKVTKQKVDKFMEDNKSVIGLAEPHGEWLVYDMYSQIDRATTYLNAQRLSLGHAIYEGGVSAFSRQFCREHNGKVFTLDEILTFRPDGQLPDKYNPILDLGGYGCSHHLNWVSYTIAKYYRPNLEK